jgi:hypothetical protein
MSVVGNIYCITCLETGEKYIGSTSKHIEVRLDQHKSINNHCSSKQIIDRNNYELTLLETMLTDKKRNVLLQERKWLEENIDVAVNKNLPCQSPEEKRAYMKQYEKTNAEYYRLYRLAHRDKWNAKIVCECGTTISRINKNTHTKSTKHQTRIQSQSEYTS